ncbi:hypothetical protein LPJ61_004981, partial [Coemansia biformis]
MLLLALLLRLLYALLAGIAAAFALAPWTREAFVRYGKTRQPLATHGRPARQAAAAVVALERFAAWTVPKNWFSQFYYVGAGVGIPLLLGECHWAWFHRGPRLPGMPAARVLGIAALLEHPRDGSIAAPSAHAALALLMYVAHVLVRLKETVFDQPPTDATMHIGQYAVGLLFYVATPFALVVDAHDCHGWAPAPPLMVLAGLAVFAHASLHQRRCHRILFDLRRGSLRAARRARAYAIPSGDLFGHVSSPHFLCEILIYA